MMMGEGKGFVFRFLLVGGNNNSKAPTEPCRKSIGVIANSTYRSAYTTACRRPTHSFACRIPTSFQIRKVPHKDDDVFVGFVFVVECVCWLWCQWPTRRE